MKKITAILLVLLTVFGLAACGKKSGKEKVKKVKPINIKVVDRVLTEEYKSPSGGKYIINYTLPDFSEEGYAGYEDFYGNMSTIFNDACSFGKTAVAANYLKSGQTWTDTSTYEITLREGNYISILITTVIDYEDSVSTEYHSFIYDLVTGQRMGLTDFCSHTNELGYYPNYACDQVSPLIYKDFKTRFGDDGKKCHLAGNCNESLINQYLRNNPYCFFMTEEGLSFFFEKNTILVSDEPHTSDIGLKDLEFLDLLPQK